MSQPDIADKEREHFDRLAEEVGEAGSHRTTVADVRRMERRAAMIAQALGDRSNPRLLEIGVGAGAFSQYIFKAMDKFEYIGCDISPKCIQIAEEKYASIYPNVAFKVADCTSLDWEDNTFDCVCGCSILHHLPLEATLKECFRVLKPGGLFWFSEPNMANPQIAIQKNVRFVGKWLEDTEDETAFFRWSLARSLKQAQFEDMAVRPFDFLHPSTPKPLVSAIEFAGRVVESIPVLREIAGSLAIQAHKPRE